MTELSPAEASTRLRAVLDLHQPDEQETPFCLACGLAYPCATSAAAEGATR